MKRKYIIIAICLFFFVYLPARNFITVNGITGKYAFQNYRAATSDMIPNIADTLELYTITVLKAIITVLVPTVFLTHLMAQP